MRRLRIIALLSAAALVSACSINTGKTQNLAQPLPMQEPLEAAEQWQQLAVYEVENIGKAGVLSYPVYVQMPSESSAFERSYRDLLTSQLLKRGATVVLNPDAAKAQIYYRVQLSQFQPDKDDEEAYNAVITTQVRRHAQVLHSSSHIYQLSQVESGNFREQ